MCQSIVGGLKDSEGNMDEKELKRKKLSDDVMKGMMDAFPSDEQLQATKAERRGWIQKLREKGLPDMLASGAEKVSDSLTPDTREEYMESMATGVGSIGKAPAKLAVTQDAQSALRKLARGTPSAKSAALETSERELGGMVDELAEAGTYVKQGQLQRAADINNIKLRNEVRSNPKPSEGLDYKQINNASSKPAAKETLNYKKITPGEVNPAVKELQRDMMVANEMGDYKKAKELLAKIREMRGGK